MNCNKKRFSKKITGRVGSFAVVGSKKSRASARTLSTHQLRRRAFGSAVDYAKKGYSGKVYKVTKCGGIRVAGFGGKLKKLKK